MKLSHLSTMLAVALTAGCAGDPQPGGGASTNASDILILKQQPHRPFVELGTVSFNAEYHPPGSTGQFADMEGDADPIEGIRVRAAALGADAVILTSRRLINGGGASTPSRIFVRGIAIRFKKVAEAPPPGPGQAK